MCPTHHAFACHLQETRREWRGRLKLRGVKHRRSERCRVHERTRANARQCVDSTYEQSVACNRRKLRGSMRLCVDTTATAVLMWENLHLCAREMITHVPALSSRMTPADAAATAQHTKWVNGEIQSRGRAGNSQASGRMCVAAHSLEVTLGYAGQIPRVPVPGHCGPRAQWVLRLEHDESVGPACVRQVSHGRDVARASAPLVKLMKRGVCEL
jgi:hypothetical protein